METNVKKPALLLSLIMFTAMLSSCGNPDRGSGLNHMYDAPLLGNPQSLDPQFADDPSSNTVIKNLYSGLMTTDKSSGLVCCNASDYSVSEDGTAYTFHLREDNYWFFDENDDDVIDDEECIPVTADDYVFALQRILDPKMHSPYAESFSCIKGAKVVLRGLEPPDAAEVYAADDSTLVIVLEEPDAEFLNLMATSAACPCNREFFYSTKGRYGLDDRSVMSNGPFYVRQWFYDPYGNNNILYMRRNEKNWTDSYDICPSYLSFTIEKSEEAIRKKFKNDEVECFTTLNSSTYNRKKYLVEGKAAETLGLVFNPEDRYFSNAALRKAFACSIDREGMKSQLNSDDCITAYGMIPPAVNLLGRSYRELSSEKQFDMYDSGKASELFEQAKSELETETLDNVKIIVSPDTADARVLHYLTQSWQELFGCYVAIEDVTEEEFEERIAEGDYNIAVYPLKAKMNSGLSVIKAYEDTPCLQYTLPEEKISDSIKNIPTASELVESYTAAEKKLIDTCGFVPLFYKNSYLIADRDNEDIIYDPFSGAVDYRLALNFD